MWLPGPYFKYEQAYFQVCLFIELLRRLAGVVSKQPVRALSGTYLHALALTLKCSVLCKHLRIYPATYVPH